jgi:hypothetical protein
VRARLIGALAALLLLPACGLPLPEGVQSARDVQPARDEPGSLRVIPPGPQPAASPEEIVSGFLTAQSSPDGGHAVARQFLAPETQWDDEQGAVIYRGRRLVSDADQDPLTFGVRFDTTARIRTTGGFVLDTTPVDETYTVARMPSGEFRLTSVPPGLHLRDVDRENSFQPYDVYFLARGLDGGPTARLVPDPVFLPVTAERAPALVAALLLGPTLPLNAAVETAVPPTTTTASPVAVADDGVVTVDLSAQVLDLDTRQRQRLSAQLVWTLVPTFTGVRLLAAGRPLEVEGAGQVQTLDDWQEYDPAGLGPAAPLYYVQDRKLRSLDGTLPDTAATSAGPLVVDEVAVSPVGDAVGLLSRSAEGPDEVRIGPVEGPYGDPVLRGPDLGSLSWGPGEQGLWLLERGTAPAICLLPAPGAPARPDPCDVSYERPPGAGVLSALRVSRDGARAALVFGQGPERRLYIGRVVPAGGRLRIAVSPDPVAPGLTDVTDVAWKSGTSLVVLAASAAGASQIVVWTVDVDGSTSPAVVQRPGLEGTPTGVAAAPGQPLVVSTVVDGRPRLYRDNDTLFRRQTQAEPGSAPTYPG